jgi:hypothetical protein
MALWEIALTIGSAYLGYKQQGAQQDSYNQQVAYNNEAALMNYQLALSDREMLKEQNAQQKIFQGLASIAEVVRMEHAEVGARINQSSREASRVMQDEEAQRQALSTRGSAQARAGASGVSGISINAIQRAIDGSAARYRGAIQEESRMDDSMTQLGIEDQRRATEQRLISINQPIGGIPGVAPPTLQEPAYSSNFLNGLSAISTGLGVYSQLGGTFGRTSPKPATGVSTGVPTTYPFSPTFLPTV